MKSIKNKIKNIYKFEISSFTETSIVFRKDEISFIIEKESNDEYIFNIVSVCDIELEYEISYQYLEYITDLDSILNDIKNDKYKYIVHMVNDIKEIINKNKSNLDELKSFFDLLTE